MKNKLKLVWSNVIKVLDSNITLTILITFLLMSDCSTSGYKQGQKDLLKAIAESRD